MNHHPYSVHDFSPADRCRRRRASLQRAVCGWALSHSLMAVIGCGSAGPDVKTQSAQPEVPAVASDAAKSPPKEEAGPRKKETVAAPTAEQIALWTPAPFEPIQLLAIREW